MTVRHYLLGYDKANGSLRIEVAVPPARMAAIRRLLPLYADDPDALDPYELSAGDAYHIAVLAGRDVHEYSYDFFLQAFEEAADEAANARAPTAH